MKKTDLKWLSIVGGVFAAGMYCAAKGKGIFNKPRFSAQHKALRRYLETHHPDAEYSMIVTAGSGWSSMINDGRKRIFIYITRSKDGVYVFSEKLL